MTSKSKAMIALVLAVAFALGSSTALAQNAGIQISPLTYNFEITPGESESGWINVTNLEPEPMDYVVEIELFDKVTTEGAPSFTGLAKTEGVTSLMDWIEIAPENRAGQIPRGEERKIDFTINVPLGAEPGGHYAAIFAKHIKKTAEGRTELGVASRVGTLVLVSVPGVVSKTARIATFEYPKIAWSGPVRFKAQVENTGTVHYDSQAGVAINSLLGQAASVDLGTHTIIPKNIRDYEGVWEIKYPFGYYNLTVAATDGDGNKTAQNHYLIGIPLIPIIILAALILLLLLITRYVKRHFRIVAKK